MSSARHPRIPNRHPPSPSRLSVQLARMLAELLFARDQGPTNSSSDPTILRWEDEENVYLEADLAGDACLDVDLSIAVGKVMIRIGKPDAEMELVHDEAS